MDPVVHFEMPYEDRQRMVDFYAKTFGWQPQMLGEELGGYVVMTTTELDEKTKFPTKPGRINGGFFQKSKDRTKPSVVIAVADIKASMKKAAAAGAKIIDGQTPGEPDNIPGVGLYVSFMDTEGNMVSMIQPIGMADSSS